jgi:hypothetical protein
MERQTSPAIGGGTTHPTPLKKKTNDQLPVGERERHVASKAQQKWKPCAGHYDLIGGFLQDIGGYKGTIRWGVDLGQSGTEV